MKKLPLGGERLGTEGKMDVELHGYGRSTHNQSYPWGSTMSPGTLVPFMKIPATPGSDFDLELECEVLTKPTVGPLFGSYKVQLDVFNTPMRLYNRYLHNNLPRVGLNMSQVKIPQLKLFAQPLGELAEIPDIDNCQINPSCLLSYLGIRGIGLHEEITEQERDFNAIPFLMYWEIYYNYYANLQEEIGAVVHCPAAGTNDATISEVGFQNTTETVTQVITEYPDNTDPPNVLMEGYELYLNYSLGTVDPTQIMISTVEHGLISFYDLCQGVLVDTGAIVTGTFSFHIWGPTTILNWRLMLATDPVTVGVNVTTFPIENIAEMRQYLLSGGTTEVPFYVNTPDLAPYKYIYERPGGMPNSLKSQEGLAVKTYLSDKFNNWLKTEWITEISDLTAVSTVGNQFTMDAFYLQQKLYQLMNRIAVSGGSFNDWISAVYDEEAMRRAETPMYMGGMVKELQFQQVVSNAQSGNEPLGTLAGRGRMSNSQRGGTVHISTDEPSYIMGIVSITPRLVYSQGNDWETGFQTFDQWHQPGLDGIGFQDFPTEKVAWWDVVYDGADWTFNSAGKQPAYIDYMTETGKMLGNFALPNGEMFMTLNRRYEFDPEASLGDGLVDMTCYIDPGKFNFIFAQSAIDAQNFWVHIGVNLKSRRKMSARQIPNL